MRRVLGLAAFCGALFLAAPVAQASVISWDGSGITTGAYLQPNAIGIDPVGNVYVADGYNRYAPREPRVVKFTADGAYLTDWNIDADSSTGLAVGAAGVFAVDFFANKINKYDFTGSAGTPAQFGGCSIPCDGADDVYSPYGVAADAAGNAYVASVGNGQVVKFGPNGQFIASWKPADGPDAIAAAPNGDIYVAEHNKGQIERFTATGSLVSSLPVPFPDGGVAVDSDGDVYAVTGGGVSKYDPAGALLGTWDGVGGGLAVDSQRRVYAIAGGRVFRLDPSTEAPAPELTATPVAPYATQLVKLDASASAPPRLGKITRYEWDLDGDGTYETDGGTTPTIARRFQQVSTPTVGVRVTGSTGLTATKALTLNVGPPPTAITATPNPASTGEAITFDASGSAIALSDIERFEWDLDGNGSFETDTGTTPVVTHSYATRQTPNVGVRVTRSGGRVDTASTSIDIRLAPPSGELGMSINDGAFATNDPHVTLALVWPRQALSALVSNDGGFGVNQLFDVSPHLSWTLPSAGADRLPKTVYVRFRGGESGRETYTDDIVLDEGLPLVSSARAAHRALRVIGADYNTGIRTLVVKRPGAKRPLKTMELGSARSWGRRHVSVKLHLPAGLTRAYVRAIDVAGNKSRWRRVTFR
jgi:hypothetical protein